MTHIKPNSNYYSLSGKSIFEGKTGEFAEYRKCWEELPKNFILRDFPMHIDIEITSRCNLKCTFCDKLPLLKKDQLGDMDFDTFKKIIDEGSKHNLWGVKLSYRGEPLLHKDVVRMVRYAKEKGVIDIYFNTNAMPLTKIVAEQLIDAGLDRISISIEGTDPVKFEKERIGAKFDVILNNIKTLRELKMKKNVTHPKIRIQTVYFEGLDLDEYKKFWAPHCDEVAAVDFKDTTLRKKGIVKDWACPQLWQRMTIQWDGRILGCNNDDTLLLSPGNIKDKTIYDCWHDSILNSARSLHKDGKSHLVEACDGCVWRTAQINKLEKQDKRV